MVKTIYSYCIMNIIISFLLKLNIGLKQFIGHTGSLKVKEDDSWKVCLHC